MAGKISRLCRENPNEKILAIIGAGHEKEIMGLVKENLKKPYVGYSFTVD
jgi:hypothetical protein